MIRLLLAASLLALTACGSDEPAPPPPLRTASLPPASRPAFPAPRPRERPPEMVAGNWYGQVRDRGMRGDRPMGNWQLVLYPDGSYQSVLTYPAGGTMRHWGSFSVGQGFIRLNLEGWEPRQECGDRGCTTLQLPPQDTIVVAGMDDSRIVTDRGTLARVQ